MKYSYILLIFILAISCDQVSAQTKLIKYKKYLIPVSAPPFDECGSKPAILISSDIGELNTSADPDDIQSLIHYMHYADRFDTRGIVGTPSTARDSLGIINRVLSAYALDYLELNSHPSSLGYPQRSTISVAQGQQSAPLSVNTVATYNPAIANHAGIKLIIDEAQKVLNRETCGPLNILVWGGITDVASALRTNPEIAEAIRVYYIADFNRFAKDQNSYLYIKNNFLDQDNLWFIQNEDSFKGAFANVASNGNTSAYQTGLKNELSQYGCMGQILNTTAPTTPLKIGDTPSVLYYLNGDADDPTSASWGGNFDLISGRAQYWIDVPETSLNITTTAILQRVSNTIMVAHNDWKLNAARAGFGCD